MAEFVERTWWIVVLLIGVTLLSVIGFVAGQGEARPPVAVAVVAAAPVQPVAKVAARPAAGAAQAAPPQDDEAAEDDADLVDHTEGADAASAEGLAADRGADNPAAPDVEPAPDAPAAHPQGAAGQRVGTRTGPE